MSKVTWFSGGMAAAVLLASTWVPASAQTKMRVQASFPPTSVAMDGFRLWADRVKTMSAGRIDMEGLAAGTVVPAFEVLDAVHKGVVDRFGRRERIGLVQKSADCDPGHGVIVVRNSRRCRGFLPVQPFRQRGV